MNQLTSMYALKLECFLATSANILCDSSCLFKYVLYGSSVFRSLSWTINKIPSAAKRDSHV